MSSPPSDKLLDPSDFTRKSVDPYLISGRPPEPALDCPNPHTNKGNVLPKLPETIEGLAQFLIANSGEITIAHAWYSGGSDATTVRRSYGLTIEHLVDVEPDPGLAESVVLTHWDYDDFRVPNETEELVLLEAVLKYVGDSNNEKLRAMLDAVVSKDPDSALLFLKKEIEALRDITLQCSPKGIKWEFGEERELQEELASIYGLVQTWTPMRYYWYDEPCVRREGIKLVTECLEPAETYRMPVVEKDENYQFKILGDLDCGRDPSKNLFPTISVTPRRVYFHTGQPQDEYADPAEVLQATGQKDRLVEEIKDIAKKAFDLRIIIRGYTDKQGAIDYDNQGLSLRRAQWLRNILEQEVGHHLGYIRVQGCGDKYAPKEPLDSPEDRVAVIEFVSASQPTSEVR